MSAVPQCCLQTMRLGWCLPFSLGERTTGWFFLLLLRIRSFFHLSVAVCALYWYTTAVNEAYVMLRKRASAMHFFLAYVVLIAGHIGHNGNNAHRTALRWQPHWHQLQYYWSCEKVTSVTAGSMFMQNGDMSTEHSENNKCHCQGEYSFHTHKADHIRRLITEVLGVTCNQIHSILVIHVLYSAGVHCCVQCS